MNPTLKKILLLALLSIFTQQQGLEFTFNLDGNTNDFQTLPNGLSYIKDKKIFVKDIRTGKIGE